MSLTLLEQHQLEVAARRLVDEFNPSTPPVVVHRVIAEVLGALLSEARFTRYVPLLTERQSRERLQGMDGAGDRPGRT